MHAQAGYHGSSLDHVYTIERASVRADAADADRGFIRHANRPCPCEQCLQGGNSACTVKRLFVNASQRSSGAQACMAACTATRSKVTGAWMGGAVDGTVVAVRVHSDQSYFLAGFTRDVDDVGVNAQQVKWRNNTTQIVGTMLATRTFGCCGFGGFASGPCSAQQIDTAADGGATQACGYKFAPAEKTVVFPASAVIARSKTHAAVQTLARVSGTGHWWLPAAAHTEALADGLDLLA